MLTRLRRRLGATLLLMLSAIFVVESSAILRCQMHTGAGARRALPVASHHAESARAGHPQHAQHGSMVTDAPAPDGPVRDGGCHCAGHCLGGSGVATLASITVVLTAQVAVEHAVASAPVGAPAAGAQTRLPFATAPPPVTLA